MTEISIEQIAINLEQQTILNKLPSELNKEETTTNQYHDKIDINILNKLIEHNDVQCLNISTVHNIFLEIKKYIEIILDNKLNIDEWKYKNTFKDVLKNHYDNIGNKKLQYVQMNWIDSFVTSFIMYLYH